MMRTKLATGYVSLVIGIVMLLLAFWSIFNVDASRRRVEDPDMFWIFGGVGCVGLLLGAFHRSNDELDRSTRAIIVKASLTLVVVYALSAISLVTGIWMSMLRAVGVAS